MTNYYKIYTAKAPVNIAVIKYWGKSDEELKVPINDSISGTLDINDMSATTSASISDSFPADELWLNGIKQSLETSPAKVILERMRSLSKLDLEKLSYKVHIVSYNNFPTAAGLASSAAGYACLTFVLGHLFGITDRAELSKLARLGSGSACRSLYGGFVQWIAGSNHDDSMAVQIVDQNHWSAMRVLICVINDQQKDVSSSKGMRLSVETSDLIKERATNIVKRRIEKMKSAILERDFDKFAKITMQDSNQFHAICLDTFPPIFYLNEPSRQIIKMCHIINDFHGCCKVAYTFDAGPNACIYLLDDFVDQFIDLVKKLHPLIEESGSVEELKVSGLKETRLGPETNEILLKHVKSKGITEKPNSLKYLINTSIGDGPKLVEDNLTDDVLRP